jgi:predicted membrane-bound mannosyltransferase
MTTVSAPVRVLPRPAVVALVLTLSLLALGLRFWRLGEMPLFGDEAYYLQFIDHPAPAYVDHPIGIAVLLGLSTALGGRTEIGVRWLNAVLGVVCVPLAFAMGRRYVSVGGGLIAASVVAFAPVFVVTGRVTFPDALHAVLLLVNLLTLAPLLEGEDEGWRSSIRHCRAKTRQSMRVSRCCGASARMRGSRPRMTRNGRPQHFFPSPLRERVPEPLSGEGG